MTHNYTRFAFYSVRTGELRQMLELDLTCRTALARQRLLRVWFARILRYEPEPVSIRVSVGSQVDL